MEFVTAARKEDSVAEFPSIALKDKEAEYAGKEAIFRVFDYRNKIVRRNAAKTEIVSELEMYLANAGIGHNFNKEVA